MRSSRSALRGFALAAGSGLLCLPFGSQAFAIVKTIEARGDWTLAAGTDEGGTQVCSAATTGTQIYMAVKIYANSRHITVHLAKSNWKIPSGTKTRVLMHFDQTRPWSGVAYGTRHASLLETSIPLTSIKSFVGQFARAQELIVAFPEGSERPWQISMRGSRYIMGRLADCVSLMANRGGGATQPFANQPGPTQPFDNAPAPQPAPTPAPPAPFPAEPKPPLPSGERI